MFMCARVRVWHRGPVAVHPPPSGAPLGMRRMPLRRCSTCATCIGGEPIAVGQPLCVARPRGSAVTCQCPSAPRLSAPKTVVCKALTATVCDPPPTTISGAAHCVAPDSPMPNTARPHRVICEGKRLKKENVASKSEKWWCMGVYGM